ncbi:MAG: hypothetical protein WC637_14650 [Victivallales bacterium]
MNDKVKNLALNLIAPGIGQFGAGRWIRGLAMLSSGTASALWFSWEALYPLYLNMQNTLNDQDVEFKLFNFTNLMLSLGLLILIWAISYADLFLIKNKKEKS